MKNATALAAAIDAFSTVNNKVFAQMLLLMTNDLRVGRWLPTIG
jgi:hypothetical protein